MYQFAEPQGLVRQIRSTLRSNAGPLILAAGLLATGRTIEVATYDQEVKGLTIAAAVEVALLIAGNALATLVGCWAVLSGGRPAGFAGLRAVPPKRAAPFLGYAVLFYLWFLILAALLGRFAAFLMVGEGPDTSLSAAVVGLITTVTLILMYLQLGFLFPDTVQSGESSVIFAMALGFSAAGRVIAAVAPPALILILPQAVLSEILFGPAGVQRAAAIFPSLLDLGGLLILSGLGAAGAMACAVAMTRQYQALTQALPDGAWR